MKMKKLIVCLLMMAICFNVAFAAKAFRQEFKMNKSSYVPFDATTVLTLDCPDSEGAKWLKAHFAEWFGDASPKVVEGVTALTLPEPPADAKADKHVARMMKRMPPRLTLLVLSSKRVLSQALGGRVIP